MTVEMYGYFIITFDGNNTLNDVAMPDEFIPKFLLPEIYVDQKFKDWPKALGSILNLGVEVFSINRTYSNSHTWIYIFRKISK